jgi:hypothetical protein
MRNHRPLRSSLLVVSLLSLGTLVWFGRPQPVRGKPAAAPKAEKIDVKAIKCEEGSVKFVPRDVKLACKDEYRDCETDISLVAKNCSKDFLEFTKLEMYEQNRRSLILEFSPASIVPPGAAWQEKVPWTTVGNVEAVVFFRPAGSSNVDKAMTDVKVRNHALDTAKAACEKCSGTWGRYGINNKERCNCKTKDAGKKCTDGNQCQGQCLFDGYDNKGYENGHCSDIERVAGCVNIVAKGQSKLPPRNPPPRKLPTCLD